MSILNKYIAQILLKQIGLVLVILLAIFSIFNFLAQVGDIGKQAYALNDAILYVLLTLPLSIQVVLPMIIMIGVMLGVGQLMTHHEWVIMRSSGLTAKKITTQILITGIAVIIFIIVINEFFAFDLHRFATNYQKQALGQQTIGQSKTWLKKGNEFIYIQSYGDQHNTINVIKTKDNKITNIASSDEVDYRTKAITLMQVNTQHIFKLTGGNYQINQTQQATQLLNIRLPQSVLSSLHLAPEYLNTWQLWQQINYLSSHNLPYIKHQQTFYSRLAQPILLFTMILMGLVFMFKTKQNFNIGQQVFLGIVFSFTLNIVNRLMVEVSLTYVQNVVFSMIAPIVILLFVAIILLYKNTRRI